MKILGKIADEIMGFCLIALLIYIIVASIFSSGGCSHGAC